MEPLSFESFHSLFHSRRHKIALDKISNIKSRGDQPSWQFQKLIYAIH